MAAPSLGMLSRPLVRRYPAHVQAAEVAAARADLKLLHVEGDEQAAQVTLSGGGDTVKIAVRKREGTTVAVKSCGAEPETVYAYEMRLL